MQVCVTSHCRGMSLEPSGQYQCKLQYLRLLPPALIGKFNFKEESLRKTDSATPISAGI
jgi:hypothetical protein